MTVPPTVDVALASRPQMMEPLWRLYHTSAWICLVLTAGLIFLGALVTSFGAGMAVPDGETTFGQTLWLYKWWDKSFGIQLEHTHRLAGMTVGIAALATYFIIFFTSKRQELRWLAAGMLFAVILQGLLGRFRVMFNAILGTSLAAIHGGCAQIVVLLEVLLIMMTSRWWVRSIQTPSPVTTHVQKSAVSLAILSYVQIVLGVLFRHRNVGFHLHATVGYLLLIGIMVFGVLVLVNADVRRRLGQPLLFLAVGIVLQIILGNASALATQLVPREFRPPVDNMSAFLTASHLLVGSVFFSASVVTTVMAFRTLRRHEP